MAEDEKSVVGKSPPPRKADVLFGSGSDYQANACVSYGFGDITYQDGYRRAALHLAEHVCETGRGQDFLVYPIVYLYRHHIEMVLKSLVSVGCILLDRELTDKKDVEALGRHDLAKLWKLARPLLNPVCELAGNPEFPPADLEGIDAYVRQLHEHDPDGQRFRYARTKNRKPSLHPDLRHINIGTFAVALEKLADYLDAVEAWFDDLADRKAEMRAQYAREAG